MEPQTRESMAELVKDLHANKTLWVPSGLESRINWGPPVECISKNVSVKGLKKIIAYEKNDLTITVEAGLPLYELQTALAEENQWFPIDWPWGSQPAIESNSAGSIGGLIARGLSGGLRHQYLGVRDQIIGISLIRTDGIIAQAGGRVVKNVAGFDLMRLLCGSWGSLALITDITLRTQPIKPFRARVEINGSLKKLEDFRSAFISGNFTPEYCDWVCPQKEDWYLDIGLASISKEVVNDQIQRLNSLANELHIKTKEHSWEGPLIEQKFPLVSSEKQSWLIRIALPPKKIYDFLISTEAQNLPGWNWRIAAGVGIGDGWTNVNDSSENLTTNSHIKNLRNLISSLQGQLIILSQPYALEEYIPAWLNAPSKKIIKAIKKEFDPEDQLSIGRLPGVSE